MESKKVNLSKCLQEILQLGAHFAIKLYIQVLQQFGFKKQCIHITLFKPLENGIKLTRITYRLRREKLLVTILACCSVLT